MIRVIKEHVLKYFQMYMRQGIGIAFFAFFMVVLIKRLRVKKGKRDGTVRLFIQSMTMALLAMYIYIVIGITLLSRRGGYDLIINMQITNLLNSSFSDRMFVYENILLFIPLSIFLFILAESFRNLGVSLFTGFLCSFLIETIQLLTHRGRFELDDIVANVMGMLFGFLLCRTVIKIYRKIMG